MRSLAECAILATVRVWAVSCIVLAACGRIGFDAANAVDARGGDASPDAIEVLVVDPPFGTPTLITELSMTGTFEDDPSLTRDQLEIYFTSQRAGCGGGTDIWTSTRTSASDPWQAPRCVTEVSTALAESNAAISADGLTLVFGSGPGGDQDLFVVTRATRMDGWSVPTRLDALDQAGTNDFGASLTDSLDAIYFSSQRSGSLEIYLARGAALAWTSPSVITELATAQIETSPFITRDEDVLWFGSDRTGTAGGQDIWVATRPSPGAPFDPPTRIAELATTNDDSDPYVSPDGHIIYFARTDAVGTDLMMATR